jgi:hypothetical protein
LHRCVQTRAYSYARVGCSGVNTHGCVRVHVRGSCLPPTSTKVVEKIERGEDDLAPPALAPINSEMACGSWSQENLCDCACDLTSHLSRVQCTSCMHAIRYTYIRTAHTYVGLLDRLDFHRDTAPTCVDGGGGRRRRRRRNPQARHVLDTE